MRASFLVMTVLTLQLAACHWGFESEGDDGIDTDSDADVAANSDGGNNPGQPDADLSFCETSDLTYANFGQGFMETYCNSCHSNTLGPGQRRGAPVSIDFDTYELVSDQANRIRIRTSVNRTMPTQSSPQPSDEERDNLAEWITCGLPQ